MKHAHHSFRVLSEARLCHMSPEQPEPQKVETKTEQPKGEAFMKVEDANSSKSVGDEAKDALDKRVGDLDKKIADATTTEAPAPQEPVDEGPEQWVTREQVKAVPKEPEAPRTKAPVSPKSAPAPVPNAAGEAKDAKPVTPDAKLVTPKPASNSPTYTGADVGYGPGYDPVALGIDQGSDNSAAVAAKGPDVPPAPDGPTGAAGNDKVGGGEKPATSENPKDKAKKDRAVDAANDVANAAAAAPAEGGEKKSDVQSAINKLKDAANAKPADWGVFLAALKEVFDSVKAIFKPEAKKDEAKDSGNVPGASPDNKGNVPSAGPAVGPGAQPGEGGNKPSEGGEKPADRQDRLRKEVSAAGSVDAFEKQRIASRDAQMDGYDTQINDEEAATRSLESANSGLKQQVDDAEQKLSDPRTKPEEKAGLEKTIRDVKVDIAANDQKIANNQKDKQELTAKKNEIFNKAETDIKEVKGMLKQATDEKGKLDTMLVGLRDNKDIQTMLQRSPDLQKIINGITVSLDERNLRANILLSADARGSLENLAKQGNIAIDKLLDGSGNVLDNNTFMDVLGKICAVVKNQPQSPSDNKADKPTDPVPTKPAAPSESKNQSSDALNARAQTIGEDIGRIVATRSKLPANEQVIVRTAFSSEVKDGKAVISVDTGQLNRGGFTPVQMDTVTQGMYPDPAAPQKLRTVPMDEAQLNQYHEKFVMSVNRAIDQTT